MRIKIPDFKFSRVISALLAICFFVYIGYIDLAHDAAASAEEKLATKIAEVEAAASASTEPAFKDHAGLRRAQIALNEYRKDVYEMPMGCNCGPEIDKYTQGYRAQWCTMFASWVANEAGTPLQNKKANSWRLVNSRDFAVSLAENGTWYSREEIIENNLQPKVGDFIVYWRGDFEDNLGHVDVVVDIDTRIGTAGLIGGNLEGRVKYRNFPYLQNYGFLGFGRPEKEEL